MNKVANVVYAYSPKNDDELELKVGDRIEVVGFEEEGWWKGKLKGRVGVFPSNFVQVIEPSSSVSAPIHSSTTNSPPVHPISAPIPANINSATNKFGNIFSNKTSKTSMSTTSLNSNNSSSNSNINNSGSNTNNNTTTTNNNNSNNNNSSSINNGNTNINQTMNNTQHQNNSGLSSNDDPSMNFTERRPKPVRGHGYGDIFAAAAVAAAIKAKPLPADPTSILTNNDRLSSTMATTLQKQIPRKPPPPAPARPMDSISSGGLNGGSTDQAPALPPKPANQFNPLNQHNRPLPPSAQPSQPQQVRQRAKVLYSYEPTNDDELAIEKGDTIEIIDKNIEDQGWWKGELRGRVGLFPDNFVQLIDIPDTTTNVNTNQDWHHHRATQPSTPNFTPATDYTTRSVFAGTPKGFSKELESNLEKSSSPASFLSLKRNRIQQHQLNDSTFNENGKREEVVGSPEATSTKLNHITANRAKGPSRRPPSNVVNKRNQLDQVRRESNGRDDASLVSLPVSSSFHSASDSLSSLPTGQHTDIGPNLAQVQAKIGSEPPIPASMKPSSSLDDVVETQAPMTPKTTQRVTQATPTDKSKNTSTPPWMVELKKAHAEKKRETPSHVSKITDGCSEISELREEVRQLREDFKYMDEIKNILEVMRTELKVCQSATENQKRYIKELVSNLADERRKIAAMQVEIDRTLK